MRIIANSLRSRLAALVTLLLAAALAAHTAYSTWLGLDSAEQLLAERALAGGRRIAALLESAGGTPASQPASASLAAIRSLAAAAGLSAIERVGRDGSVAWRLTADDAPPLPHAARRTPPHTAGELQRSAGRLIAWLALQPAPAPSAWLRLEVEDGPLRTVRDRLLWHSALLAVVALVLGGLAARALLVRPTRALAQLADLAERLDAEAVETPRLEDRSTEFLRLELGMARAAQRIRARHATLAANEDRYRRILDDLHVLAFELDAKMHVAYLNSAWQRFVSRATADMLGQPLSALLAGSEREVAELGNALEALAASDDPDATLELSVEDELGDRHWLRLRIQAHRRQEELLGYFGSAVDISDQKRTEQALAEGQALAEEARRSKSSFLANMSHEFRTPMNAFIGMTDLVLETKLGEEQAGFLRQARGAAENLLRMINEILDYSKMESGRLDFEQIQFGLRDCIEQAFASHRGAAEKKGLLLEYRVDPTVPDGLEGDPHRLRQVLQVLISNAIKFTEHGHVVTRITADQVGETECVLRFSVEDTGIGIAAKAQDTVFEAFTQVDESATRRYGGTGLGLAIARRLVEHMGGQLELSSELGSGSTFAFSAKMLRQADAAAVVPEIALDALRIMVAGASPSETAHLTDALAEWQFRAERETLGSRVLDRLRRSGDGPEQPFHVLLLGDRMKDMDAFELARRLRADASIRQPLIVLAATSGQRGDAAQCRQIGINAYLTRPLRSLDLLDAIMAGLGNRRSDNLITRHSLREKRRTLQILVATQDSERQIVSPLEALGHVVHWVGNGVEAVESCHAAHFDLIILDGMLGSPDAMTVLIRLRAMADGGAGETPVITLVPAGYQELAASLQSAGATLSLESPPRITTLVGALRQLTSSATPGEQQSTRAAASSSPGLQIFDERKALDYLDNDEELLAQLIHVYLESDVSLRMRLREALALGDLHAAHAAVHAIGGSVGSFMAEATLAAVHRVEQRCRTGNAKGMDNDLKLLWQEMDRLAAALGARLQDSEPGSRQATRT